MFAGASAAETAWRGGAVAVVDRPSCVAGEDGGRSSWRAWRERRGTAAAAVTCGWSSCPAIRAVHTGELPIWLGCLATQQTAAVQATPRRRVKGWWRWSWSEWAGGRWVTRRRGAGARNTGGSGGDSDRSGCWCGGLLLLIHRETGREGDRKKGEGAGGAGSGTRSLAVAASATGWQACQARLSTLA
ncbi:hypothetical protein VPH35_025421 [Triticum aestivum]